MGIVPVGIVFDDDADLVNLELKAERLQEEREEDLKCEQHSGKTFTRISCNEHVEVCSKRETYSTYRVDCAQGKWGTPLQSFGAIRQMHGITVVRERERRVLDHHQVDGDTAMRSAKNHEYYKLLHENDTMKLPRALKDLPFVAVLRLIDASLETCAQMRKEKYMTDMKAQSEREATKEAVFAQQKLDAEREQERLAKLADAKAAEVEACKQLANAASNEATIDNTAVPTDGICSVDLNSSEEKSLEEHSKQDQQMTGAAKATTAGTEEATQPMEVDVEPPLLTSNSGNTKSVAAAPNSELWGVMQV
ncbi:GH22185 [Drosophila grimshawi]|uniref:GH22185 n=1 Tax=Drosophila grimshawi TaxID=7222 RepID=B4K0F3_DROGR|nr:GH22185 [Drosophila grimshawi]